MTPLYEMFPALFCRMPLEQFERGIAIHHAAAGPKDSLCAVQIRLVADPFDQVRAVFEATDTVIAAQRFINREFVTVGIDVGQEDAIQIRADDAKRVLEAIQRQVTIDRGKYDPVGWDVAIQRHTSRNPEVALKPDVEFVLVDLFHERRLEVNAAQWQGKFPDVDQVFFRVGFGEPVARIRLAHKATDRIVKSTGAVGADPVLEFHGWNRPIVFSVPGLSGWRAVQQVVELKDGDHVVVDDGSEEE